MIPIIIFFVLLVVIAFLYALVGVSVSVIDETDFDAKEYFTSVNFYYIMGGTTLFYWVGYWALNFP